VIQAQGAGTTLRQHRPAETGEALDTIVSAGRGALAETRRLLGVVRQAPGTEPELAPLPQLAGLTELVAGVRRAGTPVELHVEGAARPLEAVVELSAYRIIQEALTNTIKHAGPAATATVRVSYGDSELRVEVTDDGPGPAGIREEVTARGHGLAGMRTRAESLGGELTAGPASGTAGAGPAGFRVRASLPLRAPQDARIAEAGPVPPSGQIPPAPHIPRVPAR
jgi:signal transduction histidine kinase